MHDQLALVSLFAPSDVLREEVTRLASLAEAPVEICSSPQGAQNAVLRLIEDAGDQACRQGGLLASFHPSYESFFARVPSMLTLPENSAQLLELILAAASTRRGNIIGVLGCVGGVGASTLAAQLAALSAHEQSTCLIDLGDASCGSDVLLAAHRVPGARWNDLEDTGTAFLPKHLRESLPSMGKLRILAARPGQASVSPVMAERALAALATCHELTVVDLPTECIHQNAPSRRIAEWCDGIIVATHADMACSVRMPALLASLPRRPYAVAVRAVRSRAHMAFLREEWGLDRLFRLREQRLEGDLRHGVGVAVSKHSRIGRELSALGASVLEGGA